MYEMAFPLLKEFGARAAVFLVAQGVDRDNFWRDAHAEPSVRMLTGSQIREMQQEGIAFGCHGMTHRNLLRCNDAELRYEVADSKRRLEDRLGRSVDTFAYPFGAGAFDPRIRGAVVQAGYRLAFAIRQGKAHPSQDPFALHRVLIRGDDTRLDFALNVHRGKARL
ncbi:MAG: polysaccharide deacetylase family protein [Elusimicrobia bacterium]|nr:polysaccharide deacetylase family protein [Elusimicrobiota bacterium]